MLASFWMLAAWGRVDSCPKADPLHWQSVGKSFYRLREGAPCRNSTVSSARHPEISHAVWQFLVPKKFVPFPWGQFSELWQLMSRNPLARQKLKEMKVWPLGGEDPLKGGGSGNPLHYSCLKKPMGRGAWLASVHRVSRSWTRLSD